MKRDENGDTEIQKIEFAISAQLRRLLSIPEDVKRQTCRFCENHESILTKETCCTGCSKLVK